MTTSRLICQLMPARTQEPLTPSHCLWHVITITASRPDRSAVARSEGKAGVGVVHASATGTGTAAVVYTPRLALQRQPRQARAEPHGPRGQPRRGSESDRQRRRRVGAGRHAHAPPHVGTRPARSIPAARPLAASPQKRKA